MLRPDSRVALIGAAGAALLMLLAPAARGQYVLEDPQQPEAFRPGFEGVPFVYYDDMLRLSAGIAGGGSGFPQPQVNYFGAALAGTSGSYGTVTGETDLQLTPIERLFLDLDFACFHYTDFRAYVDGDPRYVGEEAGDNKSSSKNYVRSKADDIYGDATFKLLLPFGGGRNAVVARYQLDNGLLASPGAGGSGWNPLLTGRSYLTLTPFFDYQTLRMSSGDREFNTAGLRFGFNYDNTDFPLNPSSGNHTQVVLSRDFGGLDSSGTWMTVTAEFAQFLSLGESNLFRQQVLALDGWTAYAPTWHEHGDGPSASVSGAPPWYEGATLGGMNRLRGFDDSRFHGRAAVYAAAELRLIPKYDPLARIALLRSAGVYWSQFVLFAEAGSVADEYTPQKLFDEVEADAGVGLRIFADADLVRIDLAFSEDGMFLWVNLGHAF